jgi:hypothetical protein
MVNPIVKRVIFWGIALYLGGAIGFGTGYPTQVTSAGKIDPAPAVEKVQAGLTWPLFVVRAVSSS